MTNRTARGNVDLLKDVWRVTRGWKGACYGPEFLLAVLVWTLTAPYWLSQSWWGHVFTILPTVLGFTMTGFAIFLAFGSDDFKRFLARNKAVDDNAYMSVGAAFVFFVCAQLFAILFALIVNAFQFPTPDFLTSYKGWIRAGNYVAGGVGYFLFIYSLTLSLRASLRIFRLSRWYMRYLIATDTAPVARRTRKVASLTTIQNDDGGLTFCAVADDGTVWHASQGRSSSHNDGWQQLTPLPEE